ncbi:hypothetical protein DYE42_21425 [Aeromonas dhakensis]|nr:hypothetical protein DYE42_21425 [Aeromonas dhakensis]
MYWGGYPPARITAELRRSLRP